MKIQEKAVNLIKTAKHLTNEDIEVTYIALKQITDTLTRAALSAFDNGQTVLVYNSVPALSISQAIPFLTFNTKSGYKTYVFVDKYITVSREGVLTMQPPILRDLLIGALIANGLKRDYSKLANSQYMSKTTMGIYGDLFMRIINREFSIASKKDEFETLRYWVNRYFLENVFGTNDSVENIDKLSAAHIKHLDEIQMTEIKKRYDSANITSLSELLDLMKETTPRMKTLNMGMFLNDWVNYYYIPSMLACDNIEYLLFMIVTMLSGNNIINISASDIAKEAKGIKAFRGELLNLI
jgi:hypothetical protein